MAGIGIRIASDNFLYFLGIKKWTPQSLVVQTASPTNIVMTGLVANTSAVASDFTITGITATVISISRDGTNKILTLVLNVSVNQGYVLNVVY